jgi:hypothetical protein
MRTGPWEQTITMLSNVGINLGVQMTRTIGVEAKRLEKSMRDGIRLKRFNLAPNKPSTIKRKGSSTPLIDKGDLINSITSKLVTETSAFAGVLKTAKNRKNDSLVDIAAVHVKGGRNLPARDFITPAIKEREKPFQDAVEKVTKGVLRV